MVSCQKGPTCHAYAWQVGPFWQDTLDIHTNWNTVPVHGYPSFLHDQRWISPWIKPISNELDITCHVFGSQLAGHCDVITNRLWRHQQNVKRASETRGWHATILVFSVIDGFVMLCKKKNNVCTLVTNCLCAHLSVILVFISLVAAQLWK